MNAERLKMLADAYGADPRRWPEAERAAALDLMASDPVGADRLLFEARQIDLALDASPRPAVRAGLREQVIAQAAGAGLKPRRTLTWSPLAWVSGAGWAAACTAGIIVGLGVTNQFVADAEADAVLYQASLEPLDDTEVLG